MTRVAAIAIVLAGCYDIPQPSCTFACDHAATDGPQCPSGYFCSTDDRCHLSSPPYLDECPGDAGMTIDLTRPEVDLSLFRPQPGATGLFPVNVRSLDIGFSEDVRMEVDHITLVERGAGPIAGGLQRLAGTRWRFVPIEMLLEERTYDVTLSRLIEDTAGNRLLAPFEYSFTTGIDTESPMVVSVTTQGTASEGIEPRFVVVFSEPVLNVTSGTVSIVQDLRSRPVQVLHEPPSRTAEIITLEQLAPLQPYTLTLSDSIVDIGSNPLIERRFDFVTPEDTLGPRLFTTFPTSGGTVGVDPAVQITFDEHVVNADDTTLTLHLGGGPALPALVTYDPANHTATISPLRQLQPNTANYHVQIDSSIRDRFGNTYTDFPSVSFNTANDLVPPSVVSTLPLANETGVPRDATIRIEFDEPVTNVTNQTFVASGAGDGFITTVDGGYTWVFTTDDPMPPTTLVTVTLTTGIHDSALNPLPAPVSFTFTTGP